MIIYVYLVCVLIASVAFWLGRFVPNYIKNLLGLPIAASPLLVEIFLPVSSDVVAAFCLISPIGIGLMARRFWRLNVERMSYATSRNG